MNLLEIPIGYPKFKEEFPGWYKLVEYARKPHFKLNDLKKYIGLSKEQVNYWINKGVLGVIEKEPRGWRWFSLLDLFIFAVANELKKKGFDISEIGMMRYGIFNEYSYVQILNEVFVYIINGQRVFLYSDFKDITAFKLGDDKEGDDLGEGNFPLNLVIHKNTDFLAVISLDRICADLALKLDLPDFKISTDPDGCYKFCIKGVPLQLESLEADMRRRYPYSE